MWRGKEDRTSCNHINVIIINDGHCSGPKGGVTASCDHSVTNFEFSEALFTAYTQGIVWRFNICLISEILPHVVKMTEQRLRSSQSM